MPLDDKVTSLHKQQEALKPQSPLHLVKQKPSYSRPKIRLSGPQVTAKMDAMWASVHAIHTSVGYLAGMNADHPIDEHAWLLFGALTTYFTGKALYKTFMK